jgi:hypothetical protein
MSVQLIDGKDLQFFPSKTSKKKKKFFSSQSNQKHIRHLAEYKYL